MLVVLGSYTRALTDNHMTCLITSCGPSCFISKFQRVFRSFIIIRALKTRVKLSSAIYITAFSYTSVYTVAECAVQMEF